MSERLKKKEECQKGREKREERRSLLIRWLALLATLSAAQTFSLRTLSPDHKAEVDGDFQRLRAAMAQGSDSNDTSYKSPSPGSRPVSRQLLRPPSASQRDATSFCCELQRNVEAADLRFG